MTALASAVMGAGKKVVADWDNPHHRADIRRRVEAHAELLEQIERRRIAGKSTRKLVFRALRSFDGRICSLIMGWPADIPPVTYQSLRELARGLDPRVDCGEPLMAYRKKKTIGYRMICVFGPKRRALQCLVREILRACWGPSEFDYAVRGRGREAAMAKIIKVHKSRGGPRWFLTADIKSCFSSFNREGIIAMIPLPRAVIENCILIPESAHIDIEQHTETSETAARAGLPQGSLVSPFVAAKLLEPVLRELPAALKVSYADDLLAASFTQAEAESNAQSLADRLNDHPAGPLLMKHIYVAELGTPIDFLSYRVRQRPKLFGGGVRLTPAPGAFAALKTRMVEKLKSEPLASLEFAADQYRQRWASSFKMWDRSEAGDDLLSVYVLQDILAPIWKAKIKAKQFQPPTDPPFT